MEFSYPADLPIAPFLPEIGALLAEHQVVVIAGETGSGKTTQLPKLCYQLAPDHPGMVGCTQPRRIAATTVAQRVREELAGHGYLVGCKIRFHDQTSRQTRIKFMTDGVLLAETRRDPFLHRYRVIIVDEAHERNLNIDFLLGYLRRLLKKRRDLQVVITSATIDTEAFAAHFDNAPVLRVDGKIHPVEIVYLPPEREEEEASYVDQCVAAVDTICSSYPPGDMLVFLPTERDIRTCCETLRGRLPQRAVLPLFGRLQASDQQRIFKPHHQPKIVVASNVAETSLTVPGIRYVVDSGLARISTYNARSRTVNLPVTAISQANCDQRAGRCGRTGPGVCFRLFSEDDYRNRPAFAVPEIQRSNLAEVILQMIALKLGDPVAFPFLDPPKPLAIREGYRMLRELGAIDDGGRLTEYGSIMAQLPIDPVISRIIIEAEKNNCLTETVIIAAALALQDPRVRPADKEQAADQAHAAFADPRSDFIMLLTIWRRCFAEMGSFSWSALKRFCSRHYLSFQRMREWIDLHEQLTRLLQTHHRFRFNTSEASYEALHRSVLAGLFRQCARKKSGTVFHGIGNREIVLFPGSCAQRANADWIMAGSVIETSRLFALTVAAIEPEWIEAAAREFCSYSWTNPRWQKRSGQVIGDETVSLYGLTLISGRQVNFGSRDPKNQREARHIFIEHALVAGQISGSYPFLTRNRALLQQWREAEAKLRKRDVVIDDTVVHDFYDDRLPPQVYDRRSLLKALKQGSQDHLLMTQQDILLRTPHERDLLDYPQKLRHGSLELPLTYHFEPGSAHDGVTVLVPQEVLDALKPELFDWLVPGLLTEKTTFLIKGLPKRLRKQLIPINEAVDRLLDSMEIGNGNYLRALAAAITKHYRVSVTPEDWPTDLPEHLRMRFCVVDPAGREMRSGRDLRSLQQQGRHGAPDRPPAKLSARDQEAVERLRHQRFTTWDFATIRPRLDLVDEQGRTVGGLYGALDILPDDQGVRVVYRPDPTDARRTNRDGAHRLLQLAFREQDRDVRRYLKTTLTGPSTGWLAEIHGSSTGARHAIQRFVMHLLAPEKYDILTDRPAFDQTVKRLATLGYFASARRIIDLIMTLVRLRREITTHIATEEQAYPRSAGDFALLHSHLQLILPERFLDFFTEPELGDAERFLKGLLIRVERARHNLVKDREKQQKFTPYLERGHALRAALDSAEPACHQLYRDYCRLVLEYGLTLFSPEIRSKTKVSEKILRQSWQELTAQGAGLEPAAPGNQP
ncbi:ATP-dependent RNA helicase HrpA [Desulfofustis limnaeus]|jgi:ATP-dependent helicase HrpA|uniref:ATP-dependent helicase n=1 Tax=Desulfofustis limnaeus TaxID=2740163 RepID=A0ABN6M6Q0_9BACT|nr:ATP-dependent RNA helicase HrpA [Desulfofustis limnaeus]MDX9894475.1 ATP-dependent RNA helicase HrpA [Desulfofustis sp.]BDD87107.1 ATP-dependent helicase [Desulfofustis limnaeus]